MAEHVSSLRKRYVPSIPNLNSSELKSLRQIFRGDQRETLQILFARGLSIEFDQARRLFPPFELDRLIDSGLLFEENHRIKSHFQAQWYNGLIFFSDFFRWESDRDFVLPIGPAGNYLALLTIRRRVKSTLDLGCGCGIQSLLAARYSDKVVATDINPRALELTRLNAELNDIHNIETRQGNYLEPVKNQRFDLIVANLPYVIAPEKRLVYRTVEEPGDSGTHERLKEIPAYLNEGGFAQILINWIHGNDQNPSEPIRKTIENKGVDVWLIHNGSKQPDEYAEMWLKHQAQDDPHKLQELKKNWSRWYRKHHIEQIALGAITLRRRSRDQNWFCSATVNTTLEDSAAEQFLRLFAAQDYLNEMKDINLLLKEIFVPTDLAFTGNQDQPIAYADHGSQFEARIHPATKIALQKLDGSTTLERLIQAADQQQEILADFHELLKLGLIAPRQFIPSVVRPPADNNPANLD